MISPHSAPGTEQGHMVRMFAAKGGKTWNLIQRLVNRYLPEWFGLALLWRICEEICRPAIPEMTKCLDEHLFRPKRNKQESMSAWALREEQVCLQMTRALARLEQTADSMEPDLKLLCERQQNWSKWNGWSGSWRAHERCTNVLTVMMTLLGKHVRGQNMKSVICTK